MGRTGTDMLTNDAGEVTRWNVELILVFLSE